MLWSDNIDAIDCLIMICWFLWIASACIQLYFYLYYFFPFALFVKPATPKKPEAVSLIIAVKNEAENLQVNLPLWLQQEQVEFELIIVNDHSNDQTQSVLENCKDERLQVFQLLNGNGKKAAIQLGISKARYNQLVFTDADCIPASNEWLATMAQNFSNEKQIVLGHSGFIREKSFFNLLQRFENLMVAAQYFSFTLKGNAYMGVGRNLAYSKTIFEKSTVFGTHDKIKSGDDDLLVNEMATAKNVAIEWSKNGQTRSKANKKWLTYIRQKRRQLQAGEHYKLKHKAQLAAFGSSTLLFNSITLILLYLSENLGFILMTFGLALVLKSLIINKISIKLGEGSFFLRFWWLEFVLIINQTIIGISTWIWRVKRWK